MFETLDPVVLARAQFAFTVAFHFIFPSLSIGLASYLAVLNGLWLKTRDSAYLQLYHYWVRIFAILFAMGVVSGITMSYQFGTNWAVFADRAGPIIGPLMAYEVLTAFFLEAGFLGIMLFGRDKVGERLHMFACLMVALGTAVSATWILAVNSWMQTPTGFSVTDSGQFVPESWWDIVFNPSFPYRLAHTLTASYLTTALMVGGVGAWHLLRGGRGDVAVRRMFSMAMWMAALVAPLQVVLGDLHGLNTLEHQPVKVMAMEGHYQSYPDGAPLILFGIPDDGAQRVHHALEIPRLSSLILRHDPDAALAGLDTVPDAQQPPVAIVFWSFRVMIVAGIAMVSLGLWSLWCRRRGTLYSSRALLRAAVALGPSGLVAVIAGWVTTEVGRQPYTVYGELTTAQSASPVAAPAVATSLLVFVIVYFLVFGAGVFYVLRLMARTPERATPAPAEDGPLRTAGLVSGNGDLLPTTG